MKNSFLTSLRYGALCLLAISPGLNTACEKQEPAVAPPAAAPTPAPPPAQVKAAALPADASSPALPQVSPEAAALESFKTEIGKIKTFMEANQGTKDPSAGLANLKELVSRASAVRTDGLPEDLATAYQGMTQVMQRVQSTLEGLPVPVEQLAEYIDSEGKKGGTAAEEVKARMDAFKTDMENLGKEGEAAAAKLKEAGSKYGIESLDISGK